MDPLMVALRLLHIVFGGFLVGTTFFLAVILEPRLRTLGPAVQGPVMRALGPLITVSQLSSGFIVIGTGVAIALILRWGILGSFLATGWGWAMLIGFVTGTIAMVVGVGLTTPASVRLGRLGRGIVGRPPTPQEAQQMEGLSQQLRRLTMVNFVLVLIAVGAMAAARYV